MDSISNMASEITGDSKLAWDNLPYFTTGTLYASGMLGDAFQHWRRTRDLRMAAVPEYQVLTGAGIDAALSASLIRLPILDGLVPTQEVVAGIQYGLHVTAKAIVCAKVIAIMNEGKNQIFDAEELEERPMGHDRQGNCNLKKAIFKALDLYGQASEYVTDGYYLAMTFMHLEWAIKNDALAREAAAKEVFWSFRIIQRFGQGALDRGLNQLSQLSRFQFGWLSNWSTDAIIKLVSEQRDSKIPSKK